MRPFSSKKKTKFEFSSLKPGKLTDYYYGFGKGQKITLAKFAKPDIADLNRDHQISAIYELLKKFPGTPGFLQKIEYPPAKKRLGFIAKRKPNISSLREDLKNFSDHKKLTDTREKITKALKKHPYHPDLRAINAIQLFNDTKHSGLDKKKLSVQEDSLIEISKALHNGGLSLFNVFWFINIYFKYLELLKERFNLEYKIINDSQSYEIQSFSDEFFQKIMQIDVLNAVRTKVHGLSVLNMRLRGTAYIVESISREDVHDACLAIKNEDKTRKIRENKTAGTIMFIYSTLNLLFARIPILHKLLQENLESIPNVSRDIILQKNMANITKDLINFQMAMATNKINRSREISKKMYLDCLDVIRQHLDFGVLTKQYEVEPFLKAAWVIKESQGLFPDHEYKPKVQNVFKLLNSFLNRQVRVKKARELAILLQNNINAIMADAGWSK